VKKEDDVATKKITAEDDVELQRLVDSTVGPSDLMEFMRLDQGVVLRRELGPEAPNVVGEGRGVVIRSVARFCADGPAGLSRSD